jgi:hypothetical protein
VTQIKLGGNPDPSKFPGYMIGEEDNSRSRISRRLLSARQKFSFDQWADAAYDTRCIEAERLIPGLVAEMGEGPDDRRSPRDEDG